MLGYQVFANVVFSLLHLYLYCLGRDLIKKFKHFRFFTGNWPYYVLNCVMIMDLFLELRPLLKNSIIFMLNTGRIEECSPNFKKLLMIFEVNYAIFYYTMYKLIFSFIIVLMAKLVLYGEALQ